MIYKKIRKVLTALWAYKDIRLIMVAGITLFIALSLISYNPSDATWFSYSTSVVSLSNWCGFVGAHYAALFFFCWGSASLLFLIILGFYMYVVYKEISWRHEWERMAAFILLPWITSCLLYAYHLDPLQQKVPGGFVGYHFTRFLYRWCDRFGALILLHTILFACLVVIFRTSFFLVITKIFSKISFCIRRWALLTPFRRIKGHCSALGYALYTKVSSTWTSSGSPVVEQYGYDIEELDTLFARNAAEHESLESFWKHISAQVPSNAVVPADKLTPENNIIPAQTLTEHGDDSAVSSDFLSTQAPEMSKPYALPDLAIFIGVEHEQQDTSLMQELEKKALFLQEKLERFGVNGKVTAIKRGPVVTLYEYQPHIDTKISKIMTLEDDLALALQALSIRIIAPIPGKSLVGFEVANKQRKGVLLANLIKSEVFSQTQVSLPLILGEDTIGAPTIIDLARMPHLLVAGSTGSGKSVALNALLVSLLCKRSPDELRLVLIDPKRLEFAPFADIAHLLFPIVTDSRQAAPVLRWVVEQMEERYELMALAGARNIADYRKLAMNKKNNDGNPVEFMPYIVVIIDELADLMMTAGKEIEDLIIRITQMARAAGIHLIAATQRPSVDVITGLIKVNFPSRIAFRVTSKIDSRTILDCAGADKLLGSGDMLFLDGSDGQLKRVHGAYVSDKEIVQVVNHIKAERPAVYLDLKKVVQAALADDEDVDEHLYQQVVDFLQEVDDISISLLQRRFRIGYNRSARIIDKLEAHGAISPAGNGRVRKVLK